MILHAAKVALYAFCGMAGLIWVVGMLFRVYDIYVMGYSPLTYGDLALIALGAGVAWAGVGGVVSLGIRVRAWESFKLEQFELAYAHLNNRPQPEPEQHTRPETSREVTIKTTRGTAVIVQPRAAAFSSWLKDVLNPDTKTQFSKNEAKRREWEDWQYINLVAQLRGIEWLHEQRTFNGAPDLEGRHIEEMRGWLQTPLL